MITPPRVSGAPRSLVPKSDRSICTDPSCSPDVTVHSAADARARAPSPGVTASSRRDLATFGTFEPSSEYVRVAQSSRFARRVFEARRDLTALTHPTGLLRSVAVVLVPNLERSPVA